MYTQCPDCTSVFEISPEHLGAAGGMVRCGVCDTTFNALRRLTEAPPADSALVEVDSTATDYKQEAKADQSADKAKEPESTDVEPVDEHSSGDAPEQPDTETPESPADTSGRDQSGMLANVEDEDEDVQTDSTVDSSDSDASDQPSDESPTIEDDTGETDDDVLNETGEDVTVNPDDLFSTSQVLDDWDTDEGELDLESVIQSDYAEPSVQETDESPDEVGQEDQNEATERELDDDEDTNQVKILEDQTETSDDLLDVAEPLDWDLDEGEQYLQAALADDKLGDDDIVELLDDSAEVLPDDEADPEESNKDDQSEADEDSVVNPDDLFATSQILEEWDIDEGEHVLEALLADESLLEEIGVESDDSSDDDIDTDDTTEDAGDTEGDEQSDESEPEADDELESDESEQNQTDDADEQDPTDLEDESDESDLVQDDESDDIEEESTESADSRFDEEYDPELDEEKLDEDLETDQDHAQIAEADDQPEKDEQQQADKTTESEDDEHSEDTSEDEHETTGSNELLTQGVDGTFDEDYEDDAQDLKDLGRYLSPTKSLVRRLGEGLAVLLLVGGLAGQFVHYNRAELATHPVAGTHVQAFYHKLGKDLRVNWQVNDYRVARHTIVPNDDDTKLLMARATVVNNTAFNRPLPLIRLQLKNRWGDSIYGRIFGPDEYLKEAPPSVLTGNGRLEVSLDLVHPAPEEEIGYSFDVCLDTPNGPDCGTPQIFNE